MIQDFGYHHRDCSRAGEEEPVPTTMPQYCEWVITTAEMEPEAHNDLLHFANWLVMTGFGGRTPPEEEEEEEEEMTMDPSKVIVMS